MNSVTHIRDINDPRISIYRSLKVRDLKKEGVFIAESERVVTEMLKRDFKVISCLATKNAYGRLKRHLRFVNAPIFIGKKNDLKNIIGFRFHQGVLVAAEMPKRLSAEKVLAAMKKDHTLVALNNVTDPQNVGLITRNAAAFGADAMLIDKNTCDPFYRKSMRVSVGAAFKLPIAYKITLAPILKWLKKSFNTRIIVTMPVTGSKDLDDINLSGNICLVFGNEKEGVDRDVLKVADERVKIPLTRDADSINVACASSIFLYEAFAKKTTLRR